MANTYDYTHGVAAKAWDGLNKCYVLKNRVTVSDTTANTDILQLIDIPAGTYVFQVITKIVTAKTGRAGTVGHGSTEAAYWDAAIDLAASAGTYTSAVSGTDTYGTSNGHLYTDADTIDMTVDGDVNGLVIDVYAVCADVS